MIERLRDAVREAYPPGQTVVRTRDLEWLLDQVDPPVRCSVCSRVLTARNPDGTYAACPDYRRADHSELWPRVVTVRELVGDDAAPGSAT